MAQQQQQPRKPWTLSSLPGNLKSHIINLIAWYVNVTKLCEHGRGLQSRVLKVLTSFQDGWHNCHKVAKSEAFSTTFDLQNISCDGGEEIQHTFLSGLLCSYISTMGKNICYESSV
jgi:hypothetical protein